MATKRTDLEGHYYSEERVSKVGKKRTYYCWKIVVGSRGTKPIIVKRTTSKARQEAVQSKLAQLNATGAIVATKDEKSVASRLNEWLEHVKAHRKKKTYRSYLGAVKGYIIPTIGRLKADKVTYLDLQRVADAAVAKGSLRMASYSCEIACIGLDLSIRDMKKKGLIVPAHVERNRVLTEEEIGEVIEEMYSHRELKIRPGEIQWQYRDRYLIAFLLNTGLRINEGLGFLTIRLNLRKGYASIEEQMVRDKDEHGKAIWDLDETKGKKTRRIFLNPSGLQAVRSQLELIASDKVKAADGYEDNGLLFATESGKPISDRNALRTLEKIEAAINKKREADFQERQARSTTPLERTDVDLPIEHFTLHDLRRTYLTHLAAVEEKIAYVSKIAGHSNINTTLKHYVIAQEKGLRETSQKIDFTLPRSKRA